MGFPIPPSFTLGRLFAFLKAWAADDKGLTRYGLNDDLLRTEVCKTFVSAAAFVVYYYDGQDRQSE